VNVCARCGGSLASIRFTVTAAGNPDVLRPLIVGAYCSAGCLSKRLAEVCPRPDFDAAHEVARKFAEDPARSLTLDQARDVLEDLIDRSADPIDIVGLLDRKRQPALSGRLRNHGLGTPR
jgi:hypothetical protein